MDHDWGREIRARNLRQLGWIALLGVVELYLDGFTLRSAPLLAVVAWEVWFLLRPARWQAAPAEGGAGVRRELIRQGYIMQSAWAWLVVPLLIGWAIAGSPSWLRAVVMLAIGVAASVQCYREGQSLIAAANR